MNQLNEFKQEIQGFYPVDRLLNDCASAAIVYEVETDRFDDLICTGPVMSNGDVKPGCSLEAGASRLFAQRKWAECLRRVARLHPTESARNVEAIFRTALNEVRRGQRCKTCYGEANKSLNRIDENTFARQSDVAPN